MRAAVHEIIRRSEKCPRSTRARKTRYWLRAAEAETLGGDPGGVITLLADATSTGGRLNSHRSTFQQAGDDALPHYHTRSSELFFVLSGALQVLLGDEIVTLNEGDILVVPPYLHHAFGAAPGARA